MMAKKITWAAALVLVFCLISSSGLKTRSAEAFVAEATEVISVIRIGVSLVDYIYKTFKPIIADSDIDARDITDKRRVNREILKEYQVISTALDRMSQSNEQVRSTMIKLKESIPSIVRQVQRCRRVTFERIIPRRV